MASELNIKKCWFNKNHYDIPKERIDEITQKCVIVSPKHIVKLILSANKQPENGKHFLPKRLRATKREQTF